MSQRPTVEDRGCELAVDITRERLSARSKRYFIVSDPRGSEIFLSRFDQRCEEFIDRHDRRQLQRCA